MSDLSDTMVEALNLAAEGGRLVRRSGGFWTPPGEPKQDGPGRTFPADRYAKTVTVWALRRRDLLAGSEWDEPAGLTDAGRQALEER